jgi:hypothetical protein
MSNILDKQHGAVKSEDPPIKSAFGDEVLGELSGILSTDRQAVLKLATQSYPQVVEWTRKFPIIAPQRIPAVCLATAAILAPVPNQENSTATIATLAIVKGAIFSLLVAAIDDIDDGGLKGTPLEKPTLDLEDKKDLWTRCRKIVEKMGPIPSSEQEALSQPKKTNDFSEQLEQALAQWCQDVISKGQEAYLETCWYALFREHFNRMLDTMTQEAEWQTAYKGSEESRKQLFEKLNLGKYLTNGAESIAAPAVLSATTLILLTTSPKSFSSSNRPLRAANFPAELPAELKTLTDSMLLECGMATRLANEIAGYQRELQEEKINSLIILRKGEKLDEEPAIKAILTKLDEELDLLRKDGSHLLLPEDSEPTSIVLQKLAALTLHLAFFARDFYLTREIHAFSKEMLLNLTKSTL